jgi:2-(1,2-epoxy-1,2-dihydrophenyl)acetyl-CoA isomerase
MDFNRVDLNVDGAVATIRLNHPEVLNALSPEMVDSLQQALDAIAEAAPPVRCVVLTGTGRSFSSGANLQGRLQGANTNGKSAAGTLLETMFHPLVRRLRNLDVPLITAVNGPAAGAGMSLALLGDLILCARSAYFLQAFRRIGLVPDCGATWLLPRLVGRARAVELSLLGEKLPAATALAWGLVSRVYDDEALISETMKLASELAGGPTRALGLTRKLYWESEGNSFEEQIDLEQRLQRIAGSTEDFREGVQAFLEKRPAVFRGC